LLYPADALSYKHVIINAKSSEMEDILGGILADDMGLGKTLSTLAVIVNSLGRALDYAVSHTRGSTTYWQEVTPSKTTLVVVPSSRKLILIRLSCVYLTLLVLLDSWEEEIEK
jgi:SWI/SNF-related matrix-associated actin-dependent regulator of chromatin subfamily A3